MHGDGTVAFPPLKFALPAVKKRCGAPLDLRRLPHEEMNRDAELDMVSKLLLGGTSTVLLVLGLPLKSLRALEAILVAMLLRLGGLVERDEQHDRVVLEDEALVPDRSVVGQAEKLGYCLARILAPFLRPLGRSGTMERHESIHVAFRTLKDHLKCGSREPSIWAEP